MYRPKAISSCHANHELRHVKAISCDIVSSASNIYVKRGGDKTSISSLSLGLSHSLNQNRDPPRCHITSLQDSV